ncbi:RBP2A protein, partial [Polypterus senegalus]
MPARCAIQPLRLPRLAEPSGTKRRCEEVELPKELLILPLLQLKGIGQDGGLGLADNENENEVETGEPPNQEEQSEERPPGPLAEDKTQKKLLGSLQKFGLPTSGQDSEACEGQESTDPQLPPKSFLEILPPIVSKKGPRNQSSLAFLKARLKENRDMEDGIIRGVLPFEIRGEWPASVHHRGASRLHFLIGCFLLAEYYKSGSVGSIIMGPDGRIVHLSLLGSLKDQGKDLGEESQEHNGDELRGIPGISMAPGSTVFLPQEKGFHLVDYNLEQHERSALHLFDSMCQDQNTQVRDEGGQTLTASHKGSGLPVVDTWQKGQRVADKSNNTASLGGQRGSGPSSNQKGGTTAALASGRDGASLPPVLKVKRRMGFDMLKQPGDADLQNMRDPRPPVAGASPIESWKHPETSGGPESPHLGSTAARHPGDPQAGHRRLGPLVDMAGQASASNSMLRNSGHTMDIHPEGNLVGLWVPVVLDFQVALVSLPLLIILSLKQDGGTEEDGRTQHPQVGAASHQRALGKSKKGSDLKGRARFVVGKPKEKRPEDKSQAAGTTAKTAKHQRGHKRRRKVGPAEDGQGQDEEVSSAGQKAHSGKKPPRKGGLDMEEEEEKKKKEEEEDEEEEKEKGSTKQAAGRGQQGTKKEVADETAHMSFSRTSEQLRKQDTDKEDEEEEEEEEEEADFIIYKRELDSSDNKNLKARQAQAALDRNRPASLVTSGPASHLGTPSTPAVSMDKQSLPSGGHLGTWLKKLQQEAEQQQQEEQERMRQRLQAAAQERERRAQEEHRRKLLLLQKLRRQEEEQRAAEAARRQAEEDARRAEEARRMQEMSELERHEYQRWKREEEERRRREEEERQSVAAERMQRVLEEAKWQALLLARQRAVLEQQLIFQRDLLAEADGMERAQEISRPWVYSYFELLEMLGLPLPAEGVQKEA